MKRIVIAMPQLYGGGAERVAVSLAEEFDKDKDVEVHLLTYVQDLEKEYPLNRCVHRHSFNRDLAGLGRIREKILFLRGTIQKIKPDCVISLAGPAMITLLTLAMQGLHVPLILSERNDPRNYPKPFHLRVFRNWAYKKCDLVVFQTSEAMNFFPASIKEKGIVISNPLTARLPPPYFGVREKRIVTSCRLTQQKNIDLLIDAFCDISREFPQFSLYIYGDGPEKERLYNKIVQMNLEQKIRLCGYSNNIYEEIRKAAVFVLPSNYEGISNSMLESIALGVPTICTDCPVGGARETIKHGENGILVPVSDRGAMADAIRSILLNPKYAESLGKEGVKLRDKISVSTVSKQWMNIIDCVISQT